MTYTNAKYYSENGFWEKLKQSAKRVGKKLVINSLTLYYAYNDSETPMHAKAIIAAALGYLIMPLDIIPDFKPVIGYVDDAMVIGKAMVMVAIYIKDEHIDRAYETWDGWFN